MRTVAVIGTGVMGAPMARNLAAAGFDVRVWNRTAEKARALAGDGIVACGTVAEAVSGADAVLSILADGSAVLDAVAEAFGSFGDAIWIQSSTIGIDATEAVQRVADEHGITFVDAPVLGTKQPAEQGQLTVLASGPDQAKEPCTPIFEAIGSRIEWLGPAGAGTRMKLVVNNWLVGLVAALSESIALADGIDVDPLRFLAVIDGAPVNSPYAQLKGKAIAAGDFEPSFALTMARKDVGLVLDAARRAGIEPEVAQAVARMMDRAIEQGHGDEDLAAAYLGVRRH